MGVGLCDCEMCVSSGCICKYCNLAVNQLSWNLQVHVLEFEGKV